MLHQRKQVVRYFQKPYEYARLAKDAVETTMKSRAGHDLSQELVMNIFAKALFGIQQLPKHAYSRLWNLIENFEVGVILSMVPIPLPMAINPLFSAFKKTKESLDQFSQEFLEMQMDQIVEAMKTKDSENPRNNLTADVIMELMAKDGKAIDFKNIDREQIRSYFSEPDVKSLIWVFVATANIARCIENTLSLDNVRSAFYSPFHDLLKNQTAELLLSRMILERKKYENEEPFLYLSSISRLLEDEARKMSSVYHILFRPSLIDAMHDLYRKYAYTTLENEFSEISKTLESLKNDKYKKSQVDDLFDDEGQLKVDKMQIDPWLDDLYRRILAQVVQKNVRLARYTKENVTIGGLTIPANTYILIRLGEGMASTKESETEKDEKRENKTASRAPFQFFSAGPRKCPGFLVGEYIFKAVVAEYLHFIQKQTSSLIEQLKAPVEKNNEEESVRGLALR